jgi:hypothetical protein
MNDPSHALERDGFFTEEGLPDAIRIWDALLPIFEAMEKAGMDPWNVQTFVQRVSINLASRQRQKESHA